MAIEAVELDEIDEGEPAWSKVAKHLDRSVDQACIVGRLHDAPRRLMSEDIADLANGDGPAARGYDPVA